MVKNQNSVNLSRHTAGGIERVCRFTQNPVRVAQHNAYIPAGLPEHERYFQNLKYILLI